MIYGQPITFGGSSKLPKGYTQLEYIESTGTQYIDTGFKPNQDTRVVVDIEATKTGSTNFVAFGCRVAGNNKEYSIWYNYSDQTIVYSNYGNNSVTMKVANNLSRLLIDKNKNVTTINGTSYQNTANTFAPNLNLFLLSLNANGTEDSIRRISAKLYSCQIYDNGVLVRDFIPCANITGIVGLYDIVNGVFYSSAGSGEFYSPFQANYPPVHLWENASPSSSYGGGTMSFNDDYDGYIIECAEAPVYAVSSLYKHNKGFVPANAQSAVFAASWSASDDYCYYAFRKVTTTRNSITFNSTGQTSGAGGNAQRAIPLNIWGVKFTL